MLLCFDDTDGPQGGCTTHLAFRVLLELPHLALRGLPRLVRLNPNVPHKTRGNGAVCLPLGRPEGPQVRVGELRGHEILAFPEGTPAPPTAEDADALWSVLEELAQPDAVPGLLLCQDAPPAAYWQAVRTRVGPQEASRMVGLDAKAIWRTAGDGRALAGCLAAAAWPGPPSSFEFIAYREPKRWGTPREVDAAPLMALDDSVTFHSRDKDRPACIPHTPCPVLCGLRGLDPDALRNACAHALAGAAREPVDGWLLWATNQASGDHVSPIEHIKEAPQWSTVQVAVQVDGKPQDRRGGHVFVPARDEAGQTLQLAAFEPTKDFRHIVRSLMPADHLIATGALREATIHLERIDILDAPPRTLRTGNPSCCGRSMKSRGAGAGFRCASCGSTAPEEAASTTTEAGPQGSHEVPVMARRHLHRPLFMDHDRHRTQ